METGLGNLYGNIVANLKDMISTLKTVDIDLGQLKNGGENMPLDLPAAIVKFENIVWENYDASKRRGTVHVRIKFVIPFVKDAENYLTGHAVRTEVLDLFALMHDIKTVISEITSAYHTKLYLFNEGHLKSEAQNAQWTYCLDYYSNIYSDDSEISSDDSITIDYTNLINNNAFMQRTDLSVVKIGEK